MAMTGQATATEAKVEKGIRGKLVEDLKAVVAGAEELLKATASQTGERIAAARAKAEESLKAAKARLAEQESARMGGRSGKFALYIFGGEIARDSGCAPPLSPRLFEK